MQTTILSNGNSDTAVRPSSGVSPDRIMREAYEQLIRMGCADVEQWRAIHRIKPDAAAGILMMALLRQPMDRAWALAAELILALTMSPAHLFALCGDGVDYDEGRKTAVFTSRESLVRFRERFPDWSVGLRVTAVPGATHE